MSAVELLLFEAVTLAGEWLVTDSRRVAQHFGKRHDDVLRAIGRLECSEAFNRRNFAEIAYEDGRGRKQRAVQLTKVGFMFLVMGFTGTEASRIKEAYINAFNTMAEQLERRDLTLMRKLLDFEARAKVSKYRAQFGSGLMNTRRKEMPKLRPATRRTAKAIRCWRCRSVKR